MRLPLTPRRSAPQVLGSSVSTRLFDFVDSRVGRDGVIGGGGEIFGDGIYQDLAYR